MCVFTSDTCPDGFRYPSTQFKVKLAKAIIDAFPGLRSNGKLGYVRTLSKHIVDLQIQYWLFVVA
jgi:hypothetical protein